MFGGFSDNGFRPDADIPDLSRKVILVTGGKVDLHSALTAPAEKSEPRKLGSGTRVSLSASKAQSKSDISGCTKYGKGTGCNPQD
jgi:hypothetical protein